MDKEVIYHIYNYNGVLPSHKKEHNFFFLLPFAAMWMDLENIMLGEIRQTHIDEECVITYIGNLKNR